MVGRVVDFGADTVCRPPRDDERSVMKAFAAHASHCPRCTDDPYRVYLRGGTLCDRGHAYARDVAQYVYSKAGKAYSVVDRRPDRDGPCVMIEIPPRCDAVRGLLKAVDQGLKVRSQASRPVVVSYDQTYPVPERRLLPADRRGDGGYGVLEVAPRRHREERRREPASYVQTRGSLYEKDVEERRRRRKELGEPVIVYAEPRRRKEYYR